MRKKGLFSLMSDCNAYQHRKSAHAKSFQAVPEEEEVEIIVPQAKKDNPYSVQTAFYDEDEPITLSLSEVYDRDLGEAHNVYEKAHPSYHDSFVNQVDDFYVEPFEEQEQPENAPNNPENPGADGSSPAPENPVDPYQEREKEKPGIVIQDPNPKPPSPFPPPAETMPVKPGDVEKNTIPLEDEDDSFVDDIKAILSGQKTYDATSKSVMPRDASPQANQKPVPAQAKEEEDKKDEHAIFEKIAQSMQFANSYDLGSIQLDKQFDHFDQEIDQQDTQKKKALIDPNPGNHMLITREHLPATQSLPAMASAEEFLHDLDQINDTNTFTNAFSNDIPLTPKNGGFSIGVGALEVGDIILSTTSDSIISAAIRKITSSPISHASVYVGNGNVIEAIDSGVLERSIETAIRDDSVVAAFRHQHMTPDKAQIIKAFLTQKRKDGAKFDHYAMIRNLPIQVITSLCNALSPSLRDACRNFAGKIFLGTETNNEFYCSELVFAAFEAAGLKLANTSPQWTSPEDLVQLSYNGTLYYVGHLKTF